MDEETIRLQHLLDEVAGLYEQALGKMELNQQQVDLTTWLPGILRSWQSAAEEKGLNWQEEVPPELPSIQIDQDRMAQVLGNLLSNAVKYTHAGGQVKFDVEADDRELVFHVKDTGCGIQAEEMEKVLLPFFRGEQGRANQAGHGTGVDDRCGDHPCASREIGN